MTFTARYRGTDGTLREECVQAESRTAAFAALKARGISPLRLERGGLASTPGKGRGVLYTMCIVCVLLIGIGLWWWLSPGDTAKNPSVSPDVHKHPKAPIVRSPKAPTAVKTLAVRRHRKPQTKPIATTTAGPPPDLRIFDEAPPRYGEINGSNIWPRALFKTREENMIAGLLTTQPGSRVLLNGFLPGEEARLLAALDVPVEFEEIDTPEERKVKEYMIGVKKELKAAVANGERITDIVQEMRDELNRMANYRDKLRMGHALLMKEGTPQEAEEFRQEANRMLSEYGMDPIPLRSTQRARLGLDP